MSDAIVEILSQILPESDELKVALFIVILFTVTRYPWEWIGRATLYMFRWTRCYLFKNHVYLDMTSEGEPIDRSKSCLVCGHIHSQKKPV